MDTLKDVNWIHRKWVYGYTKEWVQGYIKWVCGSVDKLGSMDTLEFRRFVISLAVNGNKFWRLLALIVLSIIIHLFSLSVSVFICYFSLSLSSHSFCLSPLFISISLFSNYLFLYIPIFSVSLTSISHSVSTPSPSFFSLPHLFLSLIFYFSLSLFLSSNYLCLSLPFVSVFLFCLPVYFTLSPLVVFVSLYHTHSNSRSISIILSVSF
jgi:hypothetical protein